MADLRLRDLLPYPNFVACAHVMTNAELLTAAALARRVHIEVQGGGDGRLETSTRHVTNLKNRVPTQNALDWREDILPLMLLRDCLNRELDRRGLDPVGYPMLARSWEPGQIYQMVKKINMPAWLAQRTEETGQ